MNDPIPSMPPALVESSGIERPVPTFSLRCGDAVESLSLLANESIDLIITDPAYESLEKHRKVGTTTRLKKSKSSSNEWFQIFPNARFPDLFAELYRVLRRDRHLYILCDQETAFIIKPMGEAAGFRFWKPLIWDKVTMGMGYHYRARYEMILFFEKGKRKLNDLGIDDVLEAKRVRDGYPTEKPVSLLTTLVTQSTAATTWPTAEQPPEIVLDPFMGSGSVGEAAIRTGRRFVGCDLAPDAVELTRGRLEAIGAAAALIDVFATRARQPGQRELGLLQPSTAVTPTLTLVTRLRALADRIDKAVADEEAASTDDNVAEDLAIAADLRDAADRLVRSAAKGLDAFLAESSDESNA